MRKIHPGFIAIAILMGPAALIIGYQKVSEYLVPASPHDPEALSLIRNTYESCTQPPKLQRTVQCDRYVIWYKTCLAANTQCDVRSAYELLIELDLSPPRLKQVPSHKITVTAATAE